MQDIFVLIGLILGIILLVVGSKVKNIKALKVVGIMMILISLIIAAPDFVRGFMDGFKDS